MKEKLSITENNKIKDNKTYFPLIISPNNSIKDLRSTIELSPIKMKTFFRNNIRRRKKYFKNRSIPQKNGKDYETVKKLCINNNINDIIKENIQQKQNKESIDYSVEINEKRLGISKADQSNKDISFEKVNDIEKISKLEKKLKELLPKLIQEKEEYTHINSEYDDLTKLIEEKSLQIDVLDTEFYERKLKREEKEKERINNQILEFEKTTNNPELVQKIRDNFKRPEKKRSSMVSKMSIIDSFSESRKNSPYRRRVSIEMNNEEEDKKQLKFEQMNKMLTLKQKKEEHKRKIKQEILDLKNINLINLSKRQKIKNKYNEIKTELFNTKKELIKYYHLHLYEGLDFRGEGLSTIIRTIWNLGVEVDPSYLPSYLDSGCKDFLFARAKQYIEITKIKQLIKEYKKEFIEELQQWKNNEDFLYRVKYGQSNKSINNSFFYGKYSNKSLFPTKNKIFKTKVEDRTILKNDYPHSTLFMNSYERRINSNPDNLEMIKLTEISMKNDQLPVKIIDKNMSIDNLKYLLKNKINILLEGDRAEVERLTKEFLFNNYEDKYKVIIETLFAALFGESQKNDMLNYFSKLEKEYREKQKLIKFHVLYKTKNMFHLNKSLDNNANNK